MRGGGSSSQLRRGEAMVAVLPAVSPSPPDHHGLGWPDRAAWAGRPPGKSDRGAPRTREAGRERPFQPSRGAAAWRRPSPHGCGARKAAGLGGGSYWPLPPSSKSQRGLGQRLLAPAAPGPYPAPVPAAAVAAAALPARPHHRAARAEDLRERGGARRKRVSGASAPVHTPALRAGYPRQAPAGQDKPPCSADPATPSR